MSPIFAHRQYVWLAAYAAENLTAEQRERLAKDLKGTNPRYNVERFLEAAEGNPRGRDCVR